MASWRSACRSRSPAWGRRCSGSAMTAPGASRTSRTSVSRGTLHPSGASYRWRSTLGSSSGPEVPGSGAAPHPWPPWAYSKVPSKTRTHQSRTCSGTRACSRRSGRGRARPPSSRTRPSPTAVSQGMTKSTTSPPASAPSGRAARWPGERERACGHSPRRSTASRTSASAGTPCGVTGVEGAHHRARARASRNRAVRRAAWASSRGGGSDTGRAETWRWPGAGGSCAGMGPPVVVRWRYPFFYRPGAGPWGGFARIGPRIVGAADPRHGWGGPGWGRMAPWANWC